MTESAQREIERSSPAALVAARGGRFSTELEIDILARDDGELFKWFLASVLFGARISERIAARTYRTFAERKLTTPEAIIARGWDGLVAVLDEGGYTRYDFKTATKLLNLSRSLLEEYQGSLNRLHAKAESAEDLERRLMALAKGIGPTTVTIFLRELRGIWPKATPPLSDLAKNGAKALGFLPDERCENRLAVAQLQALWARAGGASSEFPDFETALVRHGLSLRRAKTHAGRSAG